MSTSEQESDEDGILQPGHRRCLFSSLTNPRARQPTSVRLSRSNRQLAFATSSHRLVLSIGTGYPQSEISSTDTHITVAASESSRVFNTTELLEQILLNLPREDAARLQRVSTQWHDTVTGSPKLRVALHLSSLPVARSQAGWTLEKWQRFKVKTNATAAECYDCIASNAARNIATLNTIHLPLRQVSTYIFECSLDIVRERFAQDLRVPVCQLLIQPPQVRVEACIPYARIDVPLSAVEHFKAACEKSRRSWFHWREGYSSPGGPVALLFIDGIDLENLTGVTVSDLIHGLQPIINGCDKMPDAGSVKWTVRLHLRIPEQRHD
ncbi:hypothetical protein LTR09_001437 [Extremus antarcticus]|uniref:F-box domain-containing protein n=1 Tax=Extremus antarcticus TaxID=702011 RepID=A0AAJ0GIT1_9PEZI|nr:hypothetical protein LTR09_001437 [Extremus antarcticus]